MIKIDFDDLIIGRRLNMRRIHEAQKCLHNLKPCYARVSGSKKGFHLLKFCNDGLWAEQVYDDPKRRLINEVRDKHGLTGNILFDVKSFRNVTRKAGDWQLINDGYDAERFLDYWRS